MKIIYKTEKDIPIEKLEKLFSCVSWPSIKNKELLHKALLNSDSVFTAWDNENLVGIITALTDGFINVNVHYLVVSPEYRRLGIGTNLMNKIIEKYKGCVRILIDAVKEKENYYNKTFNFKVSKGETPMIKWLQ